MKDSLILQDENYISAKRVHELFGYTSDYVGQLCRAEKLKSKMIGRSWFVSEQSVVDHKNTVDELLKNKIEERRKKNKEDYYTKNLEIKPAEVKVLEVHHKTPAIEFHPISAVPKVFALPSSISDSFLIAPFYKKPKQGSFHLTSIEKLSVAGATFIIGMMFLSNSNLIYISNSNSISHILPASVASASKEISSKIIAFITELPTLAINSFKNTFGNVLVKNDYKNENLNNKNNPSSYNGLVVLPSTGSEEKDEDVKQIIKNSFSDEVQVRPDGTGTSGVITPVFKKSDGDDFIYVLLPVKEAKTK